MKQYLYNHCHFKDLFLHHLHDFDLKNILEPRKMKLKGKKRRNQIYYFFQVGVKEKSMLVSKRKKKSSYASMINVKSCQT